MTEEIAKVMIEAKKEIEMPKEELLNKLWDLQQRLDKEIENWNTLKRHFEFLKINTTGGNKEFMEDILEIMNALEGGENNR